MTGFKLDPDALEKAIRDLEDIFFSVQKLRDRSSNLKPGELTAKDRNTRTAYTAFEQLANKDRNSFQGETDEILKTLEKKIESYKTALEEYKKTEDNASVDTGKIQQEA